MSRVLLLTPSTFGYEKRITDAVSHEGHEVLWHDERVGNGLVAKVLTRLRLIRHVPGVVSKHLNKILDAASTIDAQVLFIVNPETLKADDYQRLRESLPTARIVIYKWDSLRQKPLEDATFDWVDAVYSFDPEDCKQDTRLIHWPLFHCHKALPERHDQTNAVYDFAFVGSAHLRRIKLLARVEKQLKEQQRPHFFMLVSPSPIHHFLFQFSRRWYGYTGALSMKQQDYASYLNVIGKSRCILDVEFQRQSGLTMRTIEVIFSGTPLMTTNTSLKAYEFYNPATMFFMDKQNVEVPTVANAERSVDASLFDKFSINRWASVIIDGAQGLSWNGSRWT